MRIEINKIGYKHFNITCTEQVLVTLEEALNKLTHVYTSSIDKHKDCSTSESGCILMGHSDQSCDEDLVFLYGQMADIHGFPFLARDARRHQTAQPVPRNENETITVQVPEGAEVKVDTFAMSTPNEPLVRIDDTAILPVVTEE